MLTYFWPVMQYHWKFINKKLYIFFLWLIAILIFHTIFYYRDSDHYSAWDIFLTSIGGGVADQLSPIEMLMMLLPYFAISMLVDLYISQFMGKQAIYSMIRIKKKSWYILFHMASIFFLILLTLLVYDGALFMLAYSMYDDGAISASLFPWIASLNKQDVMFFVILPGFLAQVIGAFSVSMVQIIAMIRAHTLGSGFFLAIVLYIVQLFYPFILGRHVWLSHVVRDSGQYIVFLLSQFVIVAISIVYLYDVSKKNMLIFSERG